MKRRSDRQRTSSTPAWISAVLGLVTAAVLVTSYVVQMNARVDATSLSLKSLKEDQRILNEALHGRLDLLERAMGREPKQTRQFREKGDLNEGDRKNFAQNYAEALDGAGLDPRAERGEDNASDGGARRLNSSAGN